MSTSESTPTPRTPGWLPFPLQESEQVVEICRRHWIYFWPMVIAQLLAAVLPVVVVALLLDAAGALEGIGAQAFLVLASLYLAYWFVRIVLTWYRYRHDIWVISNQRLIDSYRRNPFDLRISTADLINVQDMAIERDGILRTMLDYGDIVCQTASEVQDFNLSGVPHPRETQALVDRERDRERNRLNG